MIRRLVAAVISAAAAAVLAASVASAQGAVSAELSVSEDQVAVGDVVRITASITHPQGHSVGPLELGETWGTLELRGGVDAFTTDNGDGTETTRISFDAQVFELGQVVTSVFEVAVTSPTGASTLAVAEPATFDVVSILRDSELRDLRPQAHLPGPRTGLIIALSLGIPAAVALAALVVRYLWVRRRLPAAGEVLSPYERAKAELADIEKMGLVGQGRVSEHCALISDAVRRYLDHGVGLGAMEATTSEISRRIGGGGLPWRLGQSALRLLSAADLVKFAGLRPGAQEARDLGTDAAGLIDELHAGSAGS